MELSDYLRVLRKRWRLVLLLPLLAVAAAALVTSRATPQYQSGIQFFVSTPSTSDAGSAYTGGLFSQQRVKSYANLLSGPRLAKAVRDRIGSGGTRGISVDARVQPDTVLLTATVTDPDPARAFAIAGAVGDVFPTLVDELEKPVDGGPATIKATVVAEPVLATDPVSPRPMRNLALALVLGSLLGVGAAVGREALDNTIKTPEQLRELADVATLGVISFDPRAAKRPLIVQDEPRAARAEAFRQLRTNLQFAEIDRPLRSVVVTSPLPGEGKSTSACNLAITLAQSGIRVLLVEGDLRRPKITDYLGIEGAVGLTSVLIGQAELDDVIQPWGQDGLDVLPSGPLPPNPAEMLASAGMREVMHELEDRYQVVIVDAPPLLPVTDAAVLATITSGALFCIRAGKVRRDQATRALEALAAVDATVLGAVFTMVPRRGPDSYSGYGYGYGYAAYASDGSRAQIDPETARIAGRTARAVAPPPVRTSKHAVVPGPEPELEPAAIDLDEALPPEQSRGERGPEWSPDPYVTSDADLWVDATGNGASPEHFTITDAPSLMSERPPTLGVPPEAPRWSVAERALAELRAGEDELDATAHAHTRADAPSHGEDSPGAG